MIVRLRVSKRKGKNCFATNGKLNNHGLPMPFKETGIPLCR